MNAGQQAAVCESLATAQRRDGTFGQAASASLESLQAKTESEVVAILGEPTNKGAAFDVERVWRYETPHGTLWLFFVNDHAQLWPSERKTEFAAEKYPAKPKDLVRAAEAAIAAEQFPEAAQILAHCLKVKPRDVTCATARRPVLSRLLSDAESKFASVEPADVHARRMVLVDLLRVHQDAPNMKVRLLELEQQILEKETAALAWIVSERQTAAKVAALAQSREAMRAAQYADALTSLEPFRGSEDAELLASEARSLWKADLDRRIRTPDEARELDALEALLSEIGQVSDVFPQETLASWKSNIGAEAARVVASKLPSTLSGGVGLARLLREAIARRAPAIAALEEFRWDALPGRGVRARVGLRVASDDTCGEAVKAEDARRQIEAAFPASVHLVEPVEAEVVVSLRLDCAERVTASDPKPLPSTYVATYQQVTNPEYVRLQAELQAAQNELAQIRAKNAANPPIGGWAGAFAGMSEGLASGRVSSLLRQLNETPPFLSQPVNVAYYAQSVSATRVARLTVKLAVEDSENGFVDAAEVSAESSASAEGVEGAMESDSQGLRNRTPEPPAAATLYTQPFDEALGAAIAPLKQLAGRAWVARANGRSREVSDLEILGRLLVAADFSSGSLEIAALNETLQTAKQANLEEFHQLRIDRSLLPQASPRAARTRALASPSPATPRAAMLDRVLDSVVTIETDKGAVGSGFFASAAGHVLTNAHVIGDATRIVVRTRGKESFLATVVKTSAAHDLALLRVQAADVSPIPLGDSVAVDVGSDVVAVGSPLGLQGTVTRGIISAVRQLDGVSYLQIDAAINPGNSGGPLLTEDGTVVGINTWKVGRQGAESLGFAVGVNEAKALFGPYLK